MDLEECRNYPGAKNPGSGTISLPSSRRFYMSLQVGQRLLSKVRKGLVLLVSCMVSSAQRLIEIEVDDGLKGIGRNATMNPERELNGY